MILIISWNVFLFYSSDRCSFKTGLLIHGILSVEVYFDVYIN